MIGGRRAGVTKAFRHNADDAGVEGRVIREDGKMGADLVEAIKAGWGAEGGIVRVAENQGDRCVRLGCLFRSSHNISFVANAVTKSSKAMGGLCGMDTAGLRIQMSGGNIDAAGNGL